MTAHVLGIDLGGSNARALLADTEGRVLREITERTATGSSEEVLEQVTRICRALTAEEPASLIGVGIGAPGVIDSDGALRFAPNLPPFGDLPLADTLSSQLGVPVVADNDVNMATLGEHRYGAARGHANAAFVAVGTGIGMGFVAGGRLQRGTTGAAGEIAALPIGGDPFDPRNQHRGPLEEAASGSGVEAQYAARTGHARLAVEIFARAADGDAQAQGVLHDQAVALALGILAVHSILDPSVIVLGGGIGSRPDVLARVRETLRRLTHRTVTVVASDLGDRAGALGAAQAAAPRVSLEALDA